MTVTTYDPQSILFTLGESILVGWNSMASARKPAFNKVDGIRGKHTRTKSFDTSAVIRISLPMSSEWNGIFSDIISQDIQYGSGRCEIMIKDTSGGTLIKSSEAYITNFADISFDNTISERVWTIQCLTTDVYSVGGTTKPVSSILDAINSGIASLF
jgi:hypothetical protein